MIGRSATLALLGAILLSACTTAPLPTPAPPPDYSRQQRAYKLAVAEADRLERQGKLREAKDWLEVAQAVSTGSTQIDADMSRIEANIRQRAESLLKEGDQAMAMKDFARSADCYERVLALDPTSSRARAALRSLDRTSIYTALAHGGGGGPPAPSVK